jgi:hypothetical protein
VVECANAELQEQERGRSICDVDLHSGMEPK